MNPKLMIKIAFLLAVGIRVASGQNFPPDWSTFAGGSGTSTAGVYTITGTIALPNVGRVNSTDFTIDGGFWSIVAAIQEPGAPRLSVRLTETNTVIVSWPMSWPGFVVMENLDLNTTNWVNVAINPVVVVTSERAAEKQVVVPRPIGNRFYRLNKPYSTKGF
jgi:hypothetical protein